MMKTYIALVASALMTTAALGQDISRFEYFGSEDGLSQNSVYSVMCDDNGFLWVGTMNGFNRFDGKSFKIFSHSMSKDRAADGEPVVNGRIEHIWADDNQFVWLETYDGHYIFFNQRTEKFNVLPEESEENSDEATAFLKYSPEIVVVGTGHSGITILKYNQDTYEYDRHDMTLTDRDWRTVRVNALYADGENNLWIATSCGIYRLTSKQINELDLQAPQYLGTECLTSAVCETPSSVLWGTVNHGIVSWNKQAKNFTFTRSELIDEKSGVFLLRHIDDLGAIVGVNDARLILIRDDGVEQELSYHGSGKSVVDQVYVDKFGQIWVTTDERGVTRIDPRTTKTKFYTLTPEKMLTSADQERPCFFEDSNQLLWIGLHGGGLLRYNREKDAFDEWRSDITDDKSIPSNIVQCIVEDKSKNIWLGTGQYLGGLVRVVEDKKAFHSYLPAPKSRNHTDNVVRSLLVDKADRIWVGTKGKDICVYDKDGQLIDQIHELKCTDGTTESGMPYCMTVTKDDRLWIGTKGHGIFVSADPLDYNKLKLKNMKFIHLCRGTLAKGGQSLAQSYDYIYSIAEDRAGHVWVASYGGGLFRVTNQDSGYSMVCFNRENSGLLSDKVRYVMMDHDGGMWIGSVGGVNYIGPSALNDAIPYMEQFTYNSSDSSICYNDVCYIYQDSTESIYFATMGGGLCKMNVENKERVFKTYTYSDGLSNNSIYAITQDDQGNLWISTEHGLCRQDKNTGTFESYNENRSLAFNNFSEATVGNLKDGSIVFGGYRGFTIINPNLLDSCPSHESLVLTGLWVNNKEQVVGPDQLLKVSPTYTTSITLDYWQCNIMVSYAALDFTDSKGLRYSYMLEGFDKDWNYVGNSDRANYTNLAPGKYTLKIRHMTPSGFWSDDTRDLDITVLSPWWKTWWAIVLYVVLGVLIFILVFRIWRRIIEYREALTVEKRVNDVKLEFFTNVAHEIRTPLTLIVSPIDTLMSQDLPEEAKKQMVIIRRNADRLLKLVSQLLEFRKIQEGKVTLRVSEVDLGQFVQVCADAFTPMAMQKKIDFKSNIQRDMQKVWIDVDEMDTVIYNLLSNAFKFTESGKAVSVSVSQDAEHSYIRVKDQSHGIEDTSPEVLFKRYTILSSNRLSNTGIGLSLSYELVCLHKGDLIVDSEINRGSTFCVMLKNGHAHFDKDPHVIFADGSVDAQGAKGSDNWKTDHLVVDEGMMMLEREKGKKCPENAPNVLVVEDNADIQEYLEVSLGETYRIRCANNGEEALDRIAEEQPDVIITDIMMPVMDGNELIKAIREDFNISHILIIALSARVSVENQIETYNVGADAYIPKPFNVGQIIAITGSLLRRRREYVSRLVGHATTEDVVDDETPKSAEAETVETETSVVNNTDPENAEVSEEAPTTKTSPKESNAEEGEEKALQDIEMSISIPAKDEEFMRSVIKYVEENYKQDLSIEKFASHLNMSRTVFFNKIKGITGKGPLEFVRQIKFKIAADMLRKGYSVSEAAFEIGYSDVKYFSKLFKQMYGYSPSQVKRRNGENV